MSSYGNITITLPLAGSSQWDQSVNDAIQALADVLATQVTPAGINVTTSLDMQGNLLVSVAGVDCTPANDTGVANSHFFAQSGATNAQTGAALVAGEFYLRDGSNRLLQVTSGGSLNSTLLGGIGGNYTAAGALVSYSSATQTYSLTTDGSTPAKVVAADATFTGVTGSSLLVSGPVRLSSTAVQPASGYGLAVLNQTGSLSTVQSASFNRVVDVSRGQGSAAYSNYLAGGGWAIATGQYVDLEIDHVVGDRIDSVSYTCTGPTTGTLVYLSDNGNIAIIAQCKFSDVPLTTHTLQAGTPTMTGTLPFVPPGTGSLAIDITTNSGANLKTCRYTGLRKVI